MTNPQNTLPRPGTANRGSFLWIGTLASVVVVIMVYSLVMGSRMARHHVPLADAAMEIKVELSLAHIWLEESLAGDGHQQIGDVWQHMDQASWYVEAMLKGGEDPTEVIAPLRDAKLRRQIQNLGTSITDFRALAESRWSTRIESGIGSPQDEIFDALFLDCLRQADEVETSIHAALAEDLDRFHIAQSLAIALCVGLFLLGGIILWRAQKKQSLDSAELRESEQRMDLILHGAELGTWDWNLQTDEVVFDHYFAGMLGHTLDEFECNLATWKKLTHPDDLPRVIEVLQEHMEGQTTFYETEHRLRHKSGEWIWILDRGQVVERDVDGRPLRMCGTHRDITRQKRAEDALRKSETLLTDTARMAKIGGWDLDLDTLEVSWTEETYRIHELPPSQKPPLETAINFYHPDDRAKVRTAVQQATERGEPFDIEVRLITAKGNLLWTRAICHPVVVEGRTVKLAGTFQDITERKEAEESLFRLQAAIEAASETIMITDTDGVVQYANPEYERVTGYSREEIIGKTTQVLNSGTHDQDFYQNLWKTIRNGDVWQGVFTNRKKDGTQFFEDATISPIRNEQGKIINYVAVKRDVTQQRLMEAQLHQAQKLESIGQLAAGIAHEINTPTQYVAENTRFVRDRVNDLLKLTRQYASLLASARKKQISPAQIAEAEAAIRGMDLDFIATETPRAIEQTLEGAARVAEIVRAMRDFSHPGGRKKVPADLNKAIESTLIVCRNRWRRVADLTVNLADDLPLVPCHLGEFNQAILNIIVNAADAIEDHSGSGVKGRGQITVSSRLEGESVQIRITDTGGGVPEDIRSKIFDPFFTTKGVGKGTGQGLAISRTAIVNRLGGTIDLETDPGRGSTFIIRLPLSAEPVIEKQEAA